MALSCLGASRPVARTPITTATRRRREHRLLRIEGHGRYPSALPLGACSAGQERPAGRHGDVAHRSGGRLRHLPGLEGRYRRSQRRIRLRRVDRRPVTSDADFADLWGKLATHYKDKPDVLFMLMSEPRTECEAVAEVSQRGHLGDPRHRCHADHRRAGKLFGRGTWTWTVADNAAMWSAAASSIR